MNQWSQDDSSIRDRIVGVSGKRFMVQGRNLQNSVCINDASESLRHRAGEANFWFLFYKRDFVQSVTFREER